MKSPAFVLSVLCALLTAGRALPARAWSASGHMQIALYAYDALSEPVRREIDQTLPAHPRFREDFAPQLPPDLGEAERARWIFAFASTWPDVARGQPEYEHPTWHYINLRLYLRSDRLVSCAEARAALPAKSAASPEDAREPDSIIDALAWARSTWMDWSLPAPQRALALSWLLHLVGDAHQPLHAVALFTGGRFTAGDRGGNDVLVRGRGSLHRLWDGLLGDETTTSALDTSVRALARDRALQNVAASAHRSLDPHAWIDEDCAFARAFVYVPAVLEAVRRFERERRDGKPEVALRDAYADVARGVARSRAVQAGARLQTLLDSDPAK